MDHRLVHRASARCTQALGEGGWHDRVADRGVYMWSNGLKIALPYPTWGSMSNGMIKQSGKLLVRSDGQKGCQYGGRGMIQGVFCMIQQPKARCWVRSNDQHELEMIWTLMQLILGTLIMIVGWMGFRWFECEWDMDSTGNWTWI